MWTWLSIINMSFAITKNIIKKFPYLLCDSPDVIWFESTAAADEPHSHVIGLPGVFMCVPSGKCTRLQSLIKEM